MSHVLYFLWYISYIFKCGLGIIDYYGLVTPPSHLTPILWLICFYIHVVLAGDVGVCKNKY